MLEKHSQFKSAQRFWRNGNLSGELKNGPFTWMVKQNWQDNNIRDDILTLKLSSRGRIQ
jgi:hypothetical protein